MEFVASSKGGAKLLLNGYIYTRKATKKSCALGVLVKFANIVIE